MASNAPPSTEGRHFNELTIQDAQLNGWQAHWHTTTRGGDYCSLPKMQELGLEYIDEQ